MSEQDLKPTAIADVALPVRLVALKHLKTVSGEPVQVLCKRLDKLRMASITEQLPGLREFSSRKTNDDAATFIQKFRPLGERLIEAGCALLGANGAEQRPAFYFGHPIPGAIGGEYLETEDFLLLANTMLALNGYVGGAVADAAFPGGHGGGPSNGTRAVAGGQGHEGDAEGSA